ncbi:MAG: hypothetical protein K9L21_00570 [Spirochaetia bacterium]|nr:hypothetical protein [Spirochaetia bacterium]
MRNRGVLFLFVLSVLSISTGLVPQQISADNSSVSAFGEHVSFAAENPESLLVFDSQGILIQDLSEVSGVEPGWIIQTEDSNLEVHAAAVGTLYLSPDSLLSFDALTESGMELFLLRGKIRYLAETDSFPIIISTPVAEYQLEKKGEYVLISEQKEEFYVLEGSSTVINFITGLSRQITGNLSYEALSRQEPLKEIKPEGAKALQKELPFAYFAEIQAEADAEAAAIAQAEADAEAAAIAQAEAEAEAAAIAQAEADAEAAAIAQAEAEAEAAAIAQAEAEAEAAAIAQAEADAEAAAIAQAEAEAEAAAKTPESIAIIIDIPQDDINEEAAADRQPIEAVSQAEPENAEETASIQEEKPESASQEAKPAQPVIVIAEPPREPASAASPALTETRESFDFGLIVDAGGVMPFSSSTYNELFYLQTALTPWFRSGNFTLGLTLPLTFNINPFDKADWYLPRGNNPYDFGTVDGSSIFELISFGAGFPSSRDFYLDILSKISFAEYISANGAFSLKANNHSPISLGSGVLVSALNPALDDPFITRVGLVNTLKTPYFNYELIVNDIGHAELFGLRLAAVPFGSQSPLEIGLYGLADISLQPENRFILVPGIDVKYQFSNTEVLKLSAYADFSLLMLADSNGFHSESFLQPGGGIYNYLAAAGIQGRTGNIEFAASAAYEDGIRTTGQFGNDYQWRRISYAEDLFDDANNYTLGLNEKGRWEFGAKVGLKTDLFHTSFGYKYNIYQDFTLVSSTAPDVDELSFTAGFDYKQFSGELGFTQRGFMGMLSESFYDFMFNEQTQLFARGSFDIGILTMHTKFSGTAQYEAPDSSADFNNIDVLKTDGGKLVIVPSLSVGLTVKL